MKYMENEKLYYDRFVLEYDPILHYYGLVENYLLDIYHTSMIKPKDTVVDAGASIGDFAIKAVQQARNVIAISRTNKILICCSKTCRPMAVIM